MALLPTLTDSDLLSLGVSQPGAPFPIALPMPGPAARLVGPPQLPHWTYGLEGTPRGSA